MNNPFYFEDENLKIGFKNNRDSHNVNHAISIKSKIPTYPDFGIETGCINRNSKVMATVSAKLKNHYKSKYHV